MALSFVPLQQDFPDQRFADATFGALEDQSTYVPVTHKELAGNGLCQWPPTLTSVQTLAAQLLPPFSTGEALTLAPHPVPPAFILG